MDCVITCVLLDDYYTVLKFEVEVALVEVRGVIDLSILDSLHQAALHCVLIKEERVRLVLFEAIFQDTDRLTVKFKLSLWFCRHAELQVSI